MAIAHVQTKAGATVGHTTNTVDLTFDSSTTSGNLIVVAVTSYGATQTCNTVTDTKGNTYTKIGSVNRSPGDDTIDLFYAKNITGGASHRIDVTMANTENIGIAMSEYSGADTSSPLDTNNNSGNGTGSTATSGSITPSVNNCLIFVGGTDQRLATTTVTAGSGYTLRAMAGTADNSVRVYSEDQIQSTAAAITGDFAIGTSVTWAASIAAFKPAVGGGGGASNQYLPMMGIG